MGFRRDLVSAAVTGGTPFVGTDRPGSTQDPAGHTLGAAHEVAAENKSYIQHPGDQSVPEIPHPDVSGTAGSFHALRNAASVGYFVLSQRLKPSIAGFE